MKRATHDPWTWAVLALLLAVVIVSAVAFETASFDGFEAGFHAVPLDDSWIHFVYAESLGQHLRLDYNPGQAEAGFTSLAWVVALAPLMKLGVEPCLAAKLLGLGSLVALAFVVFHWLRRHLPPAAAAIVGLTVAADPIFGFSALSGMEVMPYALMMLLAAVLTLRGRWMWVGAALALTIAVRPDGVILLVMIWILAITHRLAPRLFASPPPPWKALLLLLLLPAAVAAGWAMYCHAATGRWLPNAYFVRTRGFDQFWSPDRLVMLLRMTMDSCLTLTTPWKGLWLAAGGAYALVRYRTWALLLLLFPVAFGMALGLGAVDVLNGTFVGNRYLVPIYPFLLGLQVLGIAGLLACLDAVLPVSKRAWARLGPVLGIGLLTPLFWPPGELLARRIDSQQGFAQACKNIEEMQVALGHWVRTETPPHAVIATHDAGAIRYLGRRHTIDVVGLNTTTGLAFADPVVLEQNADWLITFDKRTPQFAWAYRDRVDHRVVLPDNLVCAEDTMVVYRLRPSAP